MWRLIEGSHFIYGLFHFFMYNDINHGVAVTCCSICWLITEEIFFLLGHEWDKVFICFINIWFFAPGFECFVKNSGCMYIFVAEAKKLSVIAYFIDFFCKLFSVIELFKEVSDGCGWIPTRSHAIKIFCEVGGGDGSVIGVKVSKKGKRFTLTKLGDAMFESGHVFF